MRKLFDKLSKVRELTMAHPSRAVRLIWREMRSRNSISQDGAIRDPGSCLIWKCGDD